MALDPVTNFAKCSVSTGYDASATSIALDTGEGAKLPATSYFFSGRDSGNEYNSGTEDCILKAVSY